MNLQLPSDAEQCLQLGNQQAGAARWAAAEACYAASCRLRPGHAVAQHNHGVSLFELGRPQEAIAAYERALALKPDYAQACCSLGLAYRAIRAPDAALLAFDCARQLDTANPRYAIEHARLLLDLSRHAEALPELERLAAQRPNDADVRNLKGIALKNLRRPDEALADFDAAIAAQPLNAEALSNRAHLRMRSRQFSPALADLDAAMALKPGIDWLRGTRLYAASHLFDWSRHATERPAIAQAVMQGARAIQPLALQTLIDDPALQQKAARLWTQFACPPLQPPPRPAPKDKIRIAYISRDFGSHPVSYLVAEVIELHDRERFEVIALNYGPATQDPMQQRLRAAFDSFMDVEHLPEAQIAKLARTLAVDIAVDLSGFTEGARSGVFAHRAAPVQINYLGYLGTSGTKLYDYLIADATLIPPEARPFYEEHLMQLPSYQANDRMRPRPAATERKSLGLPERAGNRGVVFCCFNNPCKISPETFAAWVSILAAVPDSVLWLLDEDSEAPKNLRAQAVAQGLDPERLVFAKRTGREAYLANLAAADLFLDTLPYNAGTTASDALWMGLPVLTQLGHSLAGRMAASLLEAAGLPELIAHDADEYVALAIGLAAAPARLNALHQRLASSGFTSRLFDTPAFTRSLEAGYAQAHALAVKGEGARDIRVVG
jgi:predicted O-linked N-acetylglucosamine transferase (SPINDLY family)